MGGLYFVSRGRGMFCDRLPIPLEVCPTCGHGIKQSRGFTWVDVEALVGGLHPNCADSFPCPLCMKPDQLRKSGLLWIGERFYKTAEEFLREADELGISRRISAIPRGFKVGETWILLAHPKAIACPLNCERCSQMMTLENRDDESVLHCQICGHETPLYRPGVFRLFCPERIEKLVPESWRADPAWPHPSLRELEEKGITPVFVPDDDPDHRGTVYDDEEETNGEK